MKSWLYKKYVFQISYTSFLARSEDGCKGPELALASPMAVALASPKVASPTSKFVQDVQDGSHVVSIDNYLDQPDTTIRTSEFEMAGYRWKIRVHPNGEVEANKGYMCAFLELAQAVESPVRTKFRMYLDRSRFSSDLKDVKLAMSAQSIDEFASQGATWGHAKWKKPSELGPFLDDGTLHIYILIRVYGKLRLAEDTDNQVGSPALQDNFASDLRTLYESGDGSDVTLRAGEATLPAHAFILSLRSPVFKNMLSGEIKDTSE